MSVFRKVLGKSSGFAKTNSSVNLFPKDVWPIAGIMGFAVTMLVGTGIYIGTKPAVKWTKSSQNGYHKTFTKTRDDFDVSSVIESHYFYHYAPRNDDFSLDVSDVTNRNYINGKSSVILTKEEKEELN